MKQLFLYLILTACFIPPLELKGQNFLLNQYEYAPQYTNPSMTGDFDGIIRTSLMYSDIPKDNHQGFTNEILLIALDFRKKVKEQHTIGYGLSYYGEQVVPVIGSINTLNIDLAYSYYFNMNNNVINSISVGTKLGLGQRVIYTNYLTSTEPFNGQFPPKDNFPNNPDFLYTDIGSGINWRYEKPSNFMLRIGASFFHINNPDISFITSRYTPLETRSIIHINNEINLSHRVAFNTYIETQKQINERENLLKIGGKIYIKNTTQDNWVQIATWIRSCSTENKLTAIGLGGLAHLYQFSYGLSYERYPLLESKGIQIHFGYTMKKKGKDLYRKIKK